jgi:hypothetical protein
MWTKAWRFFNGWEVPSGVSYYDLRDTAPVLRWGMLNFALLGPLGLAGLVLALGRWRRTLPLAALIFGYAGAVVAFFVLARFRVPLLPLLAAFAGHGLSRLAKPRWALLFSGLAALLYLGVNWDQLWGTGARYAGLAWQYWTLDYGHFP